MKLSKLLTINKGMILIRVMYATYSFGMSLIFPYLTLQALGLGLTYEDISIIYGLSPIIALFAAPTAGFIGDIIGYRIVLIFNVLMVGVCGTAFNFLPVYRELQQIPHGLLFMNMSATEAGSTEMSYNLMSVQWPICQESFTAEDCQTSINPEFPDILRYLSCTEDVGEFYSFEAAAISELSNGTYCKSTNQEVSMNEISTGHILRCDIVGYPGMDLCSKTVGSHSVTFYSYLAARMAFDWTFKGVYALFDGTSLRLAEEHNSDFSKVAITNQIASVAAALIPALVLVDAEEGSGETTDYSILFFIVDGCFVTVAILSFWIQVSIKKSALTTKESLKKIWNRASLILFSFLFIMGAVMGVKDTYVVPYLTDELGASSQLISVMIFVASLASLVGNVIAKQVITFVGELNMIYIAVIAECSRLLTWAFVRASPPYYSVLLYSLDIVTIAIPLVGKMFYAYMIAPPDLIATTVAVAGVFLWTAGKGAGSFVGGQLTELLEITQVFFCTAIFGTVACSCVMAIKMAFGKKWERKVLEDKEIVMQQMHSIKDDGGGKGPDKTGERNDTTEETETTSL